MDTSLVVFNQDDFPRLAALPNEIRRKIFDVFIQEARNIVCRSYMSRIRYRFVSTLQMLHRAPTDDSDDDDAPPTDTPRLISAAEFEMKSDRVLSLEVALGHSDESALHHFWEGRFVRQRLPWTGAQVPADYETFIGQFYLVQYDRVATVLAELNWGRLPGFMRLADGEPECNYFPILHPMRSILWYLHHSTEHGLNTSMITQEGYWDSHPAESVSEKPRELATLINDMFSNYRWVEEDEEMFSVEEVLSGSLHAWYIFWRNSAIYIRTKLQDVMDLFKDPGMLQKYAGMHDFEDHDAFMDKLQSIFGYHGHATSNPLYNFTPDDFRRLEFMQNSDAREGYKDQLGDMGYTYSQKHMRLLDTGYDIPAGGSRRKQRKMLRRELRDAPYVQRYHTLGLQNRPYSLEEYLGRIREEDV
jgi:hypothetical protein